MAGRNFTPVRELLPMILEAKIPLYLCSACAKTYGIGPKDLVPGWNPKPEYQTDAYYALDLPVAPAIMLEDEIIVEGKDVDEAEFEAAIRRQLGLGSLPPRP